jgi:hypothetical protein
MVDMAGRTKRQTEPLIESNFRRARTSMSKAQPPKYEIRWPRALVKVRDEALDVHAARVDENSRTYSGHRAPLIRSLEERALPVSLQWQLPLITTIPKRDGMTGAEM